MPADVSATGSLEHVPEEGTPIAKWHDKSGNNNHVSQEAVARQPIFRGSSIGSRPTIHFTGSTMLARRNVNGLAAGDQPFHAIILMRGSAESTHASQRIMDLSSRDPGETKAADRHGFWVGYQNHRRRVRLGITNGDEGESHQVAWNGQPNLIEVQYSGSQHFSHFFNGRRDVRAMFAGTYFLGFKEQISFALGQHFGLESHEPTYLEGDIAELLLYDRPLTTVERHEIGSYLSKKYGLSAEFEGLPIFERDIQPILARHCEECHGADVQESGLDLRSVSAMLHGGKAGPVIVRGHAEYSELIGMVESGRMPPDDDARLTDEEISLLRRWIDAEAPSRERVVPSPSRSKISDEDRAHWAYQPLRTQPLPDIRNSKRVRGPIDRFVLNKLQEKGLGYSENADSNALVRRIHYDLTGLPPHPDALTALGHKQPDVAFERLVDQLLDSPHFGERWGRYWMDVAGYVEVYGSDNDADIIKKAEGKWRYRDYIIQSFNNDKPMDQFIIEQLAGDELFDWRNANKFSPEMVEALTATGFLLCANDDTDSNELNIPDVRHHVLQRTSEVVAGNLLALTLQCAKCHDHKYEAISQEDYYRFAAVFAPAFNVHHWIQSNAHGRPDVADSVQAEIDQHNAEVQSKIDNLERRKEAIRIPHRQSLFEQRLGKLPESVRETVRAAFETTEEKRNDDQKRLVAEHKEALAVPPESVESLLTEGEAIQIAEMNREISSFESQRRSYGTIQVVYEPGTPPPTHVLRRGNYLRPGLEVAPGLLKILDNDRITGQQDAVSADAADTPPAAGPSSGRRLALARQITNSTTLSGQHVARVLVNRIWQQVFGRGIVETSDNFGVSGSPPTHPELLDWLTLEFIRDGWRVKPTIKRMVMSTAYRQTSTSRPASKAEQIDPGNQWLWRMRLRRMDSELIRDAMLVASGKLDRTMSGPSIPLDPRPDGMVRIKESELASPSAKWRRSVYLLARRNYHLTMMRVFDQPIVARNCTIRQPAPAVTQALAMLHDDFVLGQADFFAQRVAAECSTLQERIQRAFEIALGRKPEADELNWCADFLDRHKERYLHAEESKSEAECAQQALAQLCHMLLNTNEFLFVP